MEARSAQALAGLAHATVKLVRAAGGVVRRRRPDETWELAIVHRPKYDDWSLPKGKAEPGESAEETALREVEEETGLACRLGDELDEIRYHDRYGHPKVVRYWLMDAGDRFDTFEPNDEIDELRWCSSREAVKLLTYDHDRALVERLEERR